jgi:hypothetical protein
MTSEPPSPATAAFLLADHQADVLERVIKAPPRVEVEPNALALALPGAVLGTLLIITTSEARRAHLANLTRAADPSHPATRRVPLGC